MCERLDCPHVEALGPNGRYYTTMGHAGFNSRANNGAGYATKAAARKKHAEVLIAMRKGAK